MFSINQINLTKLLGENSAFASVDLTRRPYVKRNLKLT